MLDPNGVDGGDIRTFARHYAALDHNMARQNCVYNNLTPFHRSSREYTQVVVRCRPFIKDESKECKDVVRVNSKEGVVRIGDATRKGYSAEDINTWREFTYDTVFDKNGSQQEIFDQSVQPIFSKVLRGFNSTIFCYGQTSSGKTHTMMGDLVDPKQHGIVPKITQALYAHIESEAAQAYHFRVTLSFLEIYNEKVFDLLRASRKDLKIRQTKSKGFHVPALSTHEVGDAKRMAALVEAGFRNRSTSATKQNEASSRSHSMLSLIISKAPKDESSGEGRVVAKLNLVDLAGSERYHASSEQLAKESTSINQSLSTLANVISALAQNRKTFIPYRNSSLTKLLKDSLGGSASTLMFANINPCDRNASETVSTLRYASRAKKIKNKPKVQVYLDPKHAMIAKMAEEISRLKQQISSRDRLVEALRSEIASGGVGSGGFVDRNSQPAAYGDIWHEYNETLAAVRRDGTAPIPTHSVPSLPPETKLSTQQEGIPSAKAHAGSVTQSPSTTKSKAHAPTPEAQFLLRQNRELKDELHETRQREQELDQEVEALAADIEELERKEVSYIDSIALLKTQVETATHREAHLKSQVGQFRDLVERKFREKSGVRRMRDAYAQETRILREEKQGLSRMLLDAQSHQRYLTEELAREQKARVDAMRSAEAAREEATTLSQDLATEKHRVEELCQQLMESRRDLEAERKAAEETIKAFEAEKKGKKRPPKLRRRESFAIRFDTKTKSGLKSLSSPTSTPRGSPRHSAQSAGTGFRDGTTRGGAQSPWSGARRLRGSRSFHISDLPRQLRASFLFKPEQNSQDRSLTPARAAWANCIAQYLNICLGAEADLVVAELMPIRLGKFATVRQMSHPLLLARFLNYTGRSQLRTYIDESKALGRGGTRHASYTERVAAVRLVIGACKAAGVDTGTASAHQFVEGGPVGKPNTTDKKNEQNPLAGGLAFSPDAVLDLANRLVEYNLMLRVSLRAQPALSGLASFNGWGLRVLTTQALSHLKSRDLLLRWVNLNLHAAVKYFDDRGQNLEAVLSTLGIRMPLTDFSGEWLMIIPVLLIAGLMGRAGNADYAVSFAAQVLVSEDFEDQVEMIEEQMREKGGRKALCFFLGDVNLEGVPTTDRKSLYSRANVLFAAAVANECSGFEEPDRSDDDEDDEDYDSSVGYTTSNASLGRTGSTNSLFSAGLMRS